MVTIEDKKGFAISIGNMFGQSMSGGQFADSIEFSQ